MQRVEITDIADLKIHCPFCGAIAIWSEGMSHCDHTLFQATDEGFEFVSSKLDFDSDIDLGFKSFDEFTDEIEYPDAIKFSIYQPAPSNFGFYIAFTPN